MATDIMLAGDFKQYMKAGKDEMKKEFGKGNFNLAIENFKKAIKLQPKNPEAHYFLGYAYSRLNSEDGTSMIKMTKELSILSSNEFEIANKLAPKYSGDIFYLDPYSKITAEWGSLAMNYLYRNDNDSALWAFSQGKKRGGFSDFYLSTARSILDFCSENSILMSSGDNLTIPLWYLQTSERYRPDVAVVDVSLLNTKWYPEYLAKINTVSFDMTTAQLDTVEYIEWSKTEVKAGDFTWELKPSYYDKFILRGDRIFLSMLRANKFRRDIFFTIGFYEESRLSLKDFLVNMILVDKLDISKNADFNSDEQFDRLTNFLTVTSLLNRNSQDELKFLDFIRYSFYQKIENYIKTDRKQKARELYEKIDTFIGEDKFPFIDDESRNQAKSIKERLW
jgi:hypothetical protein